MHAVMIMLVDLYERPNTLEAPTSRAFIDKVFLISDPDGGIVSGEDGMTVQRPLREGGREAWDMLKRLREKAWQRAGLDPDILWTAEDQINIGVAQPLNEAQKQEQAFRDGSVYQKPRNGSDDASTPRLSLPQFSTDAFIRDGLIKPERPPKSSPGSAQLSPRQSAVQPEQLPSLPSQASAPSTIPQQQQQPVNHAPPLHHAASTTDNLPQSFSASRSQPISSMPLAAPMPNPVATTSPYNNPTATPASVNSSSTYNNAPNPDPLQTWNVPTQEQMMNEHFDWDQWDAVFGKSVPMDDMEGIVLDSATAGDNEMHG